MSARTILKHLHQQGRMTDYQFDVINRNLRERPQSETTDKEAKYHLEHIYMMLSEENKKALDVAFEAMRDIAEIKEAYESDYQIQDVIEVCTKLWG